MFTSEQEDRFIDLIYETNTNARTDKSIFISIGLFFLDDVSGFECLDDDSKLGVLDDIWSVTKGKKQRGKNDGQKKQV